MAEIQVGINASGAKRGSDEVVRSLDRIRKAAGKTAAGVKTLGRSVTTVTTKLRALGQRAINVNTQLRLIGLVATAAFGFAVKGAIDFERSMSKITGLVGIASAEVKAFKQPLLDIAVATGRGPNELADALFFVTSAGARGAEALDILEASARAAAAGLGETKTVADAVTSAVNAYGAANLSAADATDVLVATVREGKAEADSIAQSLGKILPIASELGVSFNQVGATIAALTRVGLDAATSGTALRATLSQIQKPAESAEKTLAKFGTSMSEVRKRIKDEGLLPALQDLKNRFGDNEDALTKVFPNVRAVTAVLTLLGRSGKASAEIFERMTDVVGASDVAFAAAAETAGFQLDVEMTKIKITAQQLAEDFLPPLIAGIRAVGDAFLFMTEAAKSAGEGLARTFVGSADPMERMRDDLNEVNRTIALLESEGTGAIGALTAAARDFIGVDIAGIELTGSQEEQLAQLRARRDQLEGLVASEERFALATQKSEDAAKALNDQFKDLKDTIEDTPPTLNVVDKDQLDKAKAALVDLKLETDLLSASLAGLTSAGEAGLGLAEDAFAAKQLFEALQGQVNLTEQEVLALVTAKRALEEGIVAVTDALEDQKSAAQTVEDLKDSVALLAEQFVVIETKGLDAFDQIVAFQQAQEIFDKLGTDAGLSVQQIADLILVEQELNDKIGETKDKLEDAAEGFDFMKEFGIQAARNIQSSFADFLFDPFEDGLKGMLFSFAETLRRMAAEALSNQILQALFKSLGSQGGILGALGSALGSGLGGNQFGGTVQAGEAGLVGESGGKPELFIPSSSGRVLTSQQASQAISPNVTVMPAPVIVVDDPKKAIAAMQSREGQDATVTNIRANTEAVKRDLGVA